MRSTAASRLVKAGIAILVAAGSGRLALPALNRLSVGSANFMPHGYCYLWDPRILWLNVASDGFIAFSYYAIPVILIYFIRKNRNLPFNRIFWMFGGFILACGTTHLMEIWNVWHGSYLLAGLLKGATAAISLLTAAMLVPLIPKVMSLPPLIHLQEVNRKLEQEIGRRKGIEAPLEGPLRRRITFGLVVALALTLLIGVLSWRGARRAETDASWVAHTYSVLDAIEIISRKFVKAETSARGFSLSGEPALLARYENGRNGVVQDGELLRRLMADDVSQQRRLDELDPELGEALAFAANVIAQRKLGFSLSGPEILEFERLMGAVEDTTQEMRAEEIKLLAQRSESARRRWRSTKLLVGLAVFLGGTLLLLSWLAVSREIDISARARAQLGDLNADLEQRVDQRTAALKSEITERRKAGDALKDSLSRSEQILKELREQAKVLDLAQVIVRDMQGRIILWTQGAERLYGYTRPEALGRMSHDLLQTQFPTALQHIEEELRRTGTWEGELEHRKHDGSQVTVASVWVLRRDPQGRPLRILESNTDVTERKQAKERLAEQTEELARQAEELLRSRAALEIQSLMLQSVLDSMAEGLVAADEQGKFIIWNPAARKILGRDATDLPASDWTRHYGLYLEDAVTPFPAEQSPLARAIRGESSSTEMFVQNPECEQGIWIEASGGPLKDKNGMVRGGVVAFRDVTQRRADEREIRKLNDELEQRVAHRTAELEAANQELQAFTYSVSHDLRAPLRHIGGFSRMLTEDFGSSIPPEARHHLQRIEDGVHRMGRLIDELLNLGRVGRHALKVQTGQLNLIIEEVVSLLQPDAEGRAVTWKIAQLPPVECDPILIKQVFQNLIANALKFTRPRECAVIEIGHLQENGQSVIFVRDNGVGFSMKYKDKLFGVFQRLHRAEDFEGTGIGLATVQRIVRKHGGRVWAESELDKGATFFFTLEAEPAADKAGSADGTNPHASKTKYISAGA